jgi:hypothetical protein
MVAMDGFESLVAAGGPIALVVLALVDSTSIGTLVIPLLLLVLGEGGARRTAGRTVFYLLVIGVFYLGLGAILLAGLLPLIASAQGLLSSPPVMVVLAAVGVLLVVWSFRSDPKAIEKRGGDPQAGAKKWAERVRRTAGDPRALVLLALGAGVVEAASMVPYLVAMGIIGHMGVGFTTGAGILAGYCALMILPGVVLAGIRLMMGARGDHVLQRAQDWAVRNAAGAFSWAIGIIGVILVLNTAPQALSALQIPGLRVG